MKTHVRKSLVCLAALGMMGLTLNARADTVFYDPFDDGDATDGIPRTWTPVPPYSVGTFDASSGDYVLTSALAGEALVAITDDVLTNTSIRAQVRFAGPDWGCVSLLARANANQGVTYQGGIDSEGDVYLNRNDPDPIPLADAVRTDLRVGEEDVLLQLDVIGNTLSMSAWRPGESMPDQPQISVTNDVLTAGMPGVLFDQTNLGSATYRFVHVADTPIVPEPTSFLLAAIGAVALSAVACWRRRAG